MTKEELKKEGKLYASRLFDSEKQAYLHDMVVRVYIESAEPREKRIEELEKRDTELTKELTKAKELLTKAIKNTWSIDYFVVDEINDFLKEIKEK